MTLASGIWVSFQPVVGGRWSMVDGGRSVWMPAIDYGPFY